MSSEKKNWQIPAAVALTCFGMIVQVITHFSNPNGEPSLVGATMLLVGMAWFTVLRVLK